MKALFAERKTTSTKELLRTLSNRVEEQIKLAVEKFQNLPEAALKTPAANGGWSAAQCLEHLNTYGVHYLPAIEKGILSNQGMPGNAAFRNSRLGQYFSDLMKPNSGSKMKAAAKHVPAFDIDTYSVVAEFIRQQETMLRLLRKAENTDLNNIKIPISISTLIKLPLGDVFQFIVAHDTRHILQAMKVLELQPEYAKDFGNP